MKYSPVNESHEIQWIGTCSCKKEQGGDRALTEKDVTCLLALSEKERKVWRWRAPLSDRVVHLLA